MIETLTILSNSQLNEPLEACHLGGKGANLARLHQLGCPVPAFAVVPCAVFHQTLQRGGLADEVATILGSPGNRPRDGDVTVARLLTERDGTAPLRKELAQTLGSMGPHPVAVRSSADVEDAARQSCAGMLSSFLYISDVADAETAIVRCWTSLFSRSALTYLDGAGIDPLSVGVAVVIQQMVDADKAGVAFTCNPATGSGDELVIDAVFGLGEGLVSGAVEGDHLVVAKKTGAVTDHRIGTKHTKLVKDGTVGRGLTTVPIPESQRTAPCLTAAEIQTLRGLCNIVEAGMDGPQDVEWALANGRVWILQSRPITTVAPTNNVHIWDNANITESYGGITLPMTFSIVNRFYHAVFKASIAEAGAPTNVLEDIEPHLGNMLGLLDGRVYYNLLSWYNMIFCLPAVKNYKPLWEQALGLKESLPDRARDALVMTDDSPTLGDRWAKTRVALKLAGMYPGFGKRIERFTRRVDAIADHYANRDLSQLDTVELLGIYRDLEKRILDDWIEPNINDIYCFLFVGLLKTLAGKWLGERSDLCNDLIAGGSDIVSLQPARRLTALASCVVANEASLQLFAREDNDAIVRTLKTDPAVAAAATQFDAYIRDFGFRTMDELKFESPDLYDDPKQLVVMIKNAVRALNRHGDVDGKPHGACGDDADSDAARQLAQVQLRTLLFGPKRIAFELVLKQARSALRNRENTRFLRTKMFGLIRRILRGAGRDLAHRGVLSESRDVFYLTIDELFALVDGTSVTRNLQALVALRKQDYETFREERLEDRFVTTGLVYTDNDYRAPAARPGDRAETLTGLSGSVGTVRGYVKVITSPDDDLSLNGEILVAERTDPGWVTLYPSISGLLIERGSIVSHSVIVARELRIPTVVSIPNLTQILKTGDYVEVDATHGTIRRLVSDKRDQHAAQG